MCKTRTPSRAWRVAHRRLFVAAVLAATSVFEPGLARAHDWGCQVILCLSSPGGPERYSECVPPIEKLWDALRHGDPFPGCELAGRGAGQRPDTSATNLFASAAYCREDLLYWGGPEHGELLCGARGAINVEIDGQLYTRVWWDAGGANRTITEFYGAGSTLAPYDPARAAHLFLERMQPEDGDDAAGGG